MIGELPRVKLRLGRLSPRGEQKGVDLRIGLDLASHGRNRVSDLIYLLSGDDDLTEAVEEAQHHGVQVVILAVPDGKAQAHAVSRHLIRECDDIVVLEPSLIDSTVLVRTQAPQPAAGAFNLSAPSLDRSETHVSRGVEVGRSNATAPPTPAVLAGTRPLPVGSAASRSSALVYSSTTDGANGGHGPSTGELTVIDEVCRGVVTAWRAQASAADSDRVIRQEPFIPNDLDRTLLTDLSARLGVYDIDESTRYALRARFWEVMHS